MGLRSLSKALVPKPRLSNGSNYLVDEGAIPPVALAGDQMLEAEAAVLQAVDLPLHQRDLRRNVVVVARLKNRKRME